MSLEEEIRVYRELAIEIAALEKKKKELGVIILKQMTQKTLTLNDYTVKTYERLTIKTPLEVARELGATKMEEVLDKDRLKEFHQTGHTIPGITSVQFIQVHSKKASSEDSEI